LSLLVYPELYSVACYPPVLRARRGLLSGFYASLGSRSEEELKGLMTEDPALSQRREACRQRAALLNRARLEISAVV
jgi:hypothetical protein